MLRLGSIVSCLFFSFLLLAFIPFQKKKIKVYLIGDSTMAQKEIKAYPETGWGMPFTYFFDSSVVVDNRAKNGRSTKTFIAEGLWKPVVENLGEGDFVFIQFGHNDEVKTKASYTTQEEFAANLERYVAETKSKKAEPVLLTPVARRSFDSAGKLQSTHEVYSQIVRNVARKLNVPLIDLDKESQEVLKQFGPETSKLLFLQLKPGEHPNYPEGKNDNTHFNELGARVMAEIVLSEIKKLKLKLADHIYKPIVKN
jgi:lysophospholipase L1-like esterase